MSAARPQRGGRPSATPLRLDADGTYRPAGPPPDPRLERFERLANMLDTRWRVPVLGWRFGIDGLAGLVPGIGDAATGLVSAWLILEARRMGLPRRLLLAMAGNVALDFAAGSVPVIGSIFDFMFKANQRNLRLVRRHLERGRAP